jgi:hypothetical protein
MGAWGQSLAQLLLKHTIAVCLLLVACNTPTVTNGQNKATGVTEILIDRPGYEMKYYSDCTIDSTDQDFDLDSYFTLNTASNNGSISFFIFDTTIDEEEHLNVQIKSQLDGILKNGSVTYFSTWGKYKGRGAKITGKFLGTMEGEFRVFVHSGNGRSFLVASQFFNSDREKDLPGLELIEKSFTTK